MKEEIIEKTNLLRNKLFSAATYKKLPQVALILDSYFSKLTDRIKNFKFLWHFEVPNSTISSSEFELRGELFYGEIENTEINIIAFIEHTNFDRKNHILQKVFPVFVFKELGVSTLILCSKAIGLNPTFKIGDLMVITDHINLTGSNPLIYAGEIVGTKFVDMSEGYDKILINLLKNSSNELNIPVQEGIFTAVSNFSNKTSAELSWLRTIGTDAVGVSIVPQTIVAKALNLPVLAIAIIVNTSNAASFGERVKIENLTQSTLQLIDLLIGFVKLKFSKIN